MKNEGIIVSSDSILNSLKIIMAVCNTNNSNCMQCPFYIDSDDEQCGIRMVYPSEWKVAVQETWKALL